MGGTAKKIVDAAGSGKEATLMFRHRPSARNKADDRGTPATPSARARDSKLALVKKPSGKTSSPVTSNKGGNGSGDGSGGGRFITDIDAAAKDLTALFTRKAAGHLIQYMYMTPQALASWSEFMLHPEYAYVTREKSLITQVAKQDIFPEVQYSGRLVGIENGPGTDSAMQKKSGPFWSGIGDVGTLVARDQSATVVLNAPEVLHRRLPNTLIVPNKVDFLKASLPKGLPEGRRVMAEFGITRGNMQGFADDNFPVKLFKRDLKTHFKLLNPGDLYTFTFDANQTDVDKVYDSPHLTEWGREMFRVMKEELPIEGDFDPNGFVFVPRWHAEPHHVNTNNMVATRSMEFAIAGEAIRVEKGDEFAITNSYKMPLEMFEGIAEELKDEEGIELLTAARQDRQRKMTMPVLIQR